MTHPSTRAEHHDPLPAEAAERWARLGMSDTVYYSDLLGLIVEEVKVDYCRMRMPFKPELLQGGGFVHGGAIASLLDAVLVPAVGAGLPPGTGFSTVDLHVQYIGAVQDEDLVAEGWITRRGRSIAFCESEAFAVGSGRRIAKSVLTYNMARR